MRFREAIAWSPLQDERLYCLREDEDDDEAYKDECYDDDDEDDEDDEGDDDDDKNETTLDGIHSPLRLSYHSLFTTEDEQCSVVNHSVQ